MLEFLSIGQIVNTHGVKGELKVYPLTDDIDRFEALKAIYVEIKNELKLFNIVSVKYLKNMVVLKLDGIDTVDDAEKLKSAYVKVDRSKAIKLPKNSFFICDLIGIGVYDTNDVFLGDVKDILQTGSNDVYIVKNNEKEILIPALKSVVKQIDVENKKIVVELPEGLVE